MSIATEIERLQTAKADIKAAIENKGVTVGDGTIDTYAEKIGEISGGTQGFEKYASQICFNDDDSWATEDTVLNLDNLTSLQNFISGMANKIIKHLTVNCSKSIINATRSFYPNAANQNVIEHITLNADLSSCTNVQQMFCYMTNLKIIDGTPINLSSAIYQNNFTTTLISLEYIRFAANSIKLSITFLQSGNLSAESVQSIIDGLANLTGGTAQTLTLHANVGANLTDEQKAVITAKNWTLVY